MKKGHSTDLEFVYEPWLSAAPSIDVLLLSLTHRRDLQSLGIFQYSFLRKNKNKSRRTLLKGFNEFITLSQSEPNCIKM